MERQEVHVVVSRRFFYPPSVLSPSAPIPDDQLLGRIAAGSTSTYAGSLDTYPVSVRFPARKSAVPFWAFPVLGFLVKGVILIPHLVVLGVLGMVAGVLQVVTWIPVLSTGKYPEWGYSLVGGYVRWMVRVQVYFLGLSDRYPSFSMADDGSGQQTTVTFQGAQANNRLYAIPIVGFPIKAVMLIPHMFVLSILGMVVGFLQLVIWIPVVTAARYPAWAYNLNGGYIRWYARVLSFLLGLTDVYPPFQLGDSLS